MVTLDPSVAVSVVQIDDVKRVLRDNETKRLIDAAQIFGGWISLSLSPCVCVSLGANVPGQEPIGANAH